MKKKLLFALCIKATVLLHAQTDLKLRYQQPAGADWNAALPIGNGRLGAMIYGNPATELIRLNETSLWSGSPNNNNNPDALAALPEVRRLLFEGKAKEAQQLAKSKIQSKTNHGMKYEPVGDLRLDFPGHENFENYYRELDISKAVTMTTYLNDGVQYTRETFVSAPAQLIIIRLSADKPGALSFMARFINPRKQAIVSVNANELTMSGQGSDHEGVKGMVKFYAKATIKANGGTVTVAGDTAMQVSKADNVTIFISIATNFVDYQKLDGDEVKKASAYIEKIKDRNYEALRAEHIKQYQSYFNRVSLDLGTTTAGTEPTDHRIDLFAKRDDPQLAALYFQYGRYLLISSSQPGGQPANLQGIWNDKMDPPWDSKYTIDINTQMNYWPAEMTQLTEMHEPLVQMVKELSRTGRSTASEMYGARGWMAHHNTDLWRITGPVDDIYYAMWPMGGAWLSRHLWEKYLYSGDRSYLKSIYPVLKSAAQFYLDFLVEEPTHHWLVVAPSISPENNPRSAPGVSMTAGATMDNQILYELFTYAMDAGRILKEKNAFIDSLQRTRDRLPPMQIGKHGQLQEWLQDLDEPDDKHRHVSHLYGLYPAALISPYQTPALFKAARQSLLYRGDPSTGWSMGWKVNLWARLLDGDHAFLLLRNQLSPARDNVGESGGTYPNLLDAHPPFQIDGNFGCTSGIAEMLLQSHDQAIHLLPALPSNWKKGKLSGLMARGGFEIREMEWAEGKLTKLVIHSRLGGNCRIRIPNKMELSGGNRLKPAAGKNPNPFYNHQLSGQFFSAGIADTGLKIAGTIEYDFITQAGGMYVLGGGR